jgi:RES domain-containing protein
MDIDQLLNDRVFEFPGQRGDDDIRTYLNRRYSDYYAWLRTFTSGDPIVQRGISMKDRIRAAGDCIVEAINSYYNGHPSDAFDCISCAIESIWPYFAKQSGATSPEQWNSGHGLYRIRADQYLDLARQDLFHVPFELRHRVTTQRFSIPGLPCLYLGSSLYVCWEELGRPELSHVQMSYFQFRKSHDVRLLTIGPSPHYIRAEVARSSAEKGESPHRSFISQLIAGLYACWPLVLACCLKVQYPDAPFAPEYVIPQLVLQWVTSKDRVDGIQYPSVQVDYSRVETTVALNYVFPVKAKRNRHGQCRKLKNRFVLTKPTSWTLAQATRSSSDFFILNRSGERFAVVDGMASSYGESQFGLTEEILRKGTLERIP